MTDFVDFLSKGCYYFSTKQGKRCRKRYRFNPESILKVYKGEISL